MKHKKMKAWRGWCMIRAETGLAIDGIVYGQRRDVEDRVAEMFNQSKWRIARVEVRELPRKRRAK